MYTIYTLETYDKKSSTLPKGFGKALQTRWHLVWTLPGTSKHRTPVEKRQAQSREYEAAGVVRDDRKVTE